MHTMKYDSLLILGLALCWLILCFNPLLVGAFMIQANQITVGEFSNPFITYLDMLVWPLMAIGFLFNITQRKCILPTY